MAQSARVIGFFECDSIFLSHVAATDDHTAKLLDARVSPNESAILCVRVVIDTAGCAPNPLWWAANRSDTSGGHLKYLTFVKENENGGARWTLYAGRFANS